MYNGAKSLFRLYEPHRKTEQGLLHDNENRGHDKAGQLRTQQYVAAFPKGFLAIALRRHASRTEAEEGEQPVYDIENHRPYGYGGHVSGVTHVAGNGDIHQSEKRNGDV